MMMIEHRARVTEDPSIAFKPFRFSRSRLLPQDDNVHFSFAADATSFRA